MTVPDPGGILGERRFHFALPRPSHPMTESPGTRRTQRFHIQSTHRREVRTMKYALIVLGALAVIAYALIQTLASALQPLFAALSGRLH